jgi:hypothetical protein
MCITVNEQEKYCPEIKNENNGMRISELGDDFNLQTRSRTRNMK